MIFRNIREIALRTVLSTLTLLLVSGLFFADFSEARGGGKGSVHVRRLSLQNQTSHYRILPRFERYCGTEHPKIR